MNAMKKISLNSHFTLVVQIRMEGINCETDAAKIHWRCES